ncbi:ATP-dependent DNA helicase RecG [Philodulcilactobacillus myokoensis]|uniref:ATP-dependent DNA helicase RecG n=1 Tax=Philodulcilactobacillus myokoensis TaxID=2929573 RepID=A0A9W6B0N5_9LACO|nr:ATP-dependent DNA helicase RecG [Philodulcilactobacillus myokoensis]GLB46819.1 ATP-dependent DNA helicase RecG [Philodulcilactobacillus myokoensis]
MKKLSDPVNTLKGVGIKTQSALAKLGIDDINDLLTYFPFRYSDFHVKNLNNIIDGEKVTLRGKISGIPIVNYFGRRRSTLRFKLLVNKNNVVVTFFNQPWLKKQLIPGNEILVYGRFNTNRLSLSGIKILSHQVSNQMAAIYPSNKNIRSNTIKKLVQEAYQEYHQLIFDYVPEWLIKKYRLEHEEEVIHDMHFPDNQKEALLARRTAKFNEFFLYQMKLQLMKIDHQTHNGIRIKYNRSKINDFIKQLPFKLTNAQKKVVQEIDLDLTRPVQMDRLLQGDVGSGKTIVAAIAMYATIMSGYQVALMVPTEILAEQHANNLANLFKNLPIRIGLLTGSTKTTARNELLPRLANGNIDLIIGTHALIQDPVKYHRLGLAVIDEQHRFGVNQRKALRKKGHNPNVLAMTATPIPRTLAITSYGDMDVSIINEMPRGRKPVLTSWIRSKQFKDALPIILKQLKKGEQIYVVTPLVEASEAIDMRNAENIYQQFKSYFGSQFKVGLLHGRMKDEEKNQIMNDFKQRKIQILVSTTVIEVGVDVSNATMMIIYNADHFGLAQLHQLRGRVGRGSAQSYCLLIADPKNKLGEKRMQVMVDTNNGFIVSQKDLELRGPGDLMGHEQSGLPEFKVGDPVSDVVILNVAQQEAIGIIKQPDWQTQPVNSNLKLKINQDSTHDILD